jgi:hypothetical protein
MTESGINNLELQRQRRMGERVARLMERPMMTGDGKNNGEIHDDGRWQNKRRDQ